MGEEGGYSLNTLAERQRLLKQWDPTGGYDAINWFMSKLFGNSAKGDENEYYRAYLGLPNYIPGMSANAKTEWDDEIERLKRENGEQPSEFYGTTNNMDYNIQVLADTLNTGKLYRDYDKYVAQGVKLPSKSVIKRIYKTGKLMMNNPGKWTLVEGNSTIEFGYNKKISESDPLGMLNDYGAKWVPEDNAIYMHDTYDFTWPARWATGIPERPREMKIRSKISFYPEQGSWLLRDNLSNYKQRQNNRR